VWSKREQLRSFSGTRFKPNLSPCLFGGFPVTPLATRVAHELALPASKRSIDDRGNVLGLIGQDLHCFEVTAIGKTVGEAMDEGNLWGDAATMLPRAFLPSPITWLEMLRDGGRIAWVLEEAGIGFRVTLVTDTNGLYSMPVCEFASAGPLAANPILVKPLTELDVDPLKVEPPEVKIGAEYIGSGASLEVRRDRARTRLDLHEMELKTVQTTLGELTEIELFHNHGIVWSLLVLDLINTPGLIGMRQHDPHRGLARKLAACRSGSYPLRGWSEVVLKHQTRMAGEAEHPTGATFHKCLHFVRSHLRHFRDGHVTVIPAHWRGDPALGIKRTRYLVAA
jgi:hypothetical protein